MPRLTPATRQRKAFRFLDAWEAAGLNATRAYLTTFKCAPKSANANATRYLHEIVADGVAAQWAMQRGLCEAVVKLKVLTLMESEQDSTKLGATKLASDILGLVTHKQEVTTVSDADQRAIRALVQRSLPHSDAGTSTTVERNGQHVA